MLCPFVAVCETVIAGAVLTAVAVFCIGVTEGAETGGADFAAAVTVEIIAIGLFTAITSPTL